jgi:REP element-mobilizing transposase RayT
MSQSLAKNCLHITFSTKFRKPLIIDSIEAELHAYLGGVCNNLECPPVKIGGYTDHVHILCVLSKKIALIELLEQLKKRSSKWLKTKDERLKDFYWQNGYGAFSVDGSNMDRVIKYIENQKEHHKKMTFQEEYRKLLKRYNIPFDERYVWD